MKRLIVSLISIAILSTGIPPIANAWTPSGELQKITQVITWQDDSPWLGVVYVLSNGQSCYFEPTGSSGEALLTLVMSAFLSGRTVSVHCYDNQEDIGGFLSHRHHRIILYN